MTTFWKTFYEKLNDRASDLTRSVTLAQIRNHNPAQVAEEDKRKGVPPIYYETQAMLVEKMGLVDENLKSNTKEFNAQSRKLRRAEKRHKKLTGKDLNTPTSPANREAGKWTVLVTVLLMGIVALSALAVEWLLNLDVARATFIPERYAGLLSLGLTCVGFALGKLALAEFLKPNSVAKISGGLGLALLIFSIGSLGYFRLHSHRANLELRIEQQKVHTYNNVSGVSKNSPLEIAQRLIHEPITAVAYVLLSLVLSLGAVAAYQQASQKFDAWLKEIRRLRLMRWNTELKWLNENMLPLQKGVDVLSAERKRLKEEWESLWANYRRTAYQRERAGNPSAPKGKFAKYFTLSLFIASVTLGGCAEPAKHIAPATTIVMVDVSASMPRLGSAADSLETERIVSRALRNPNDRIEFLPLSSNSLAENLLAQPVQVEAATSDSNSSTIERTLETEAQEFELRTARNEASLILKRLLFDKPETSSKQSDILGSAVRVANLQADNPAQSYRLVIVTDGEQTTRDFTLAQLKNRKHGLKLADSLANAALRDNGFSKNVLRNVAVEFYLLRPLAKLNQPLGFLETFYRQYLLGFGVKKFQFTLISTR
jgi:hypothetical protein